MSSQVQNQNSSNDVKPEGWHHQNNLKMVNYPTGSSSSTVNSEGLNDSSNEANKANYNAMTKKRKAMHQANSSNRSSADETPSK